MTRNAVRRPARVTDEVTPSTAAPFVPDTTRLRVLGHAARQCRGCDLYKHATQAVFGAGPRSARLMFVGEQPGDQEDLHGAPFVGPAGALLDKALAAVGIPRKQVYVTNAVKHFKWEPRGKRRIHAIQVDAAARNDTADLTRSTGARDNSPFVGPAGAG